MGISREQALDCFSSDDLIGIGMEADAVRRRLHPEGVVTYAADRFLDLSELAPNDFTAIFEQAAAALDEGGNDLLLRGANLRNLACAEELLLAVKQRFPTVQLHGLSAPEILELAQTASLASTEILTRLHRAGLCSITGAGTEILGTERWLAVHRAAHHAGLASSVSMLFGAGETMADRVAFLEAVYALQHETGGFRAFALSSAHAPSGRDLDDATAVEYLKTLAICRMVLDNIEHVEANWQQQGLKVLQMGLRFGGNDAGSILASDTSASEEEIRRIIRDAGFRPAQRDTLYRTLYLN